MKDGAVTPTPSPSGGRSPAALLPWMMWGLGALFYCYGFFQRVAPSVMVEDLMRDFMVGAAITGTLSSLYFYAYASVQIPVGLLLDRFGSRLMLSLAGALGALGAFAFASADALGPAYIGRALIGLGAAVTWVGTLKLAAAWFPPHRFALLTGLTMALGMAGAVGGQVPLSWMVDLLGWRGAMMLAAVSAGVLTVATWLIVRDGPMSRKETTSAQEDSAVAGRGLLDGLKVVVRNPQTWWPTLFGALLVAPMLSYSGLWGVPHMVQAHGLSRAEAAAATSLMLIGWGIGSPLMGWVTDRIGRRRLPMLVAATVSLVSTLCWLYLPLPLWAVQTLQFITGLFAGGMVLLFATAREHNPAWASGATLGVVNMCVMSMGAIFQPLIGFFLDLQWAGVLVEGARVYPVEAYTLALLVLPACQVAALIGALKTKETWCRPIG